jgi:transcriptional regulator with XRE-family HTH domain
MSSLSNMFDKPTKGGDTVNLGENVKSRRVALGKSTYDLARDVGVTDVTISYVERGLRRPSLMLAMKLADALGCTLTELVGPESA